MFSNDFINDVKAKISCHDVADALGLGRFETKSGVRFYCCPLHHEKTASFAVYPDHYYCFGCQEHGSTIDLVMAVKKLPFAEAVEWICEAFGIAIPENGERSPSQVYFDVMSFLSQQFSVICDMVNGYAKWSERGFSEEFVKEYGLGIVTRPRRSGALRHTLVDKFGKLPYESWRVLDKHGNFPWQNRLIIPLKDDKGRTVSFVGRTFVGDEPKYLYLPNNEYFQKGSCLFLFNVAKSNDSIVVCEGQMDALSMHASGHKNTVALGGSSLSPIQKYLLQGKQVILALDNDTAGLNATLKIINENLRDNYLVAEHSKGKDFNDQYVADGDITFDVISDAEFVAKHLSADYSGAKRFAEYVHSKHMLVKDSSCTPRFGVNLLGLSKACDYFKASIGADFDINEIIKIIYNGGI